MIIIFSFRNDIISRIKDYNLYKDTTPADSIKHKEVGDGNLVYEGVIKLYWGLKRYITLSSGDPVYRQQRGPRESLYNYVSIDDDGFQRMFENAQVLNFVCICYSHLYGWQCQLLLNGLASL